MYKIYFGWPNKIRKITNITNGYGICAVAMEPFLFGIYRTMIAMGMVETTPIGPLYYYKQIRESEKNTVRLTSFTPPQKVIAGLAFGLWTQIVPNDIIM